MSSPARRREEAEETAKAREWDIDEKRYVEETTCTPHEIDSLFSFFALPRCEARDWLFGHARWS
jgi:hypothetical protein